MGKVRCNSFYEHSDQKSPNKLHGSMHYKIGVTCVYNGHNIYIYSVVITQ